MSQRAMPQAEVEAYLIQQINSSAERVGMSKREIASRAELGRSRTALVLKGERRLTFDEYEKLCQVFGFTGWKLLREAEREVTARED